MKPPIAILLAAGLSRRMGTQNKLLLPFQRSTIVQTTVENLLQSIASRIIVVVGHEYQKIRQVLNGYDLTIAYNEEYKKGQVGSIKKGLSCFENDMSTSFFIALADMPLITADHYDLLIARFLNVNSKNRSILRPISKYGVPGNPVLFDASFKQELLNNSNSEESKHILIFVIV